MMPKATNKDEATDTKAEAAEAVTISGAEEISVDSMDAVRARVDAAMGTTAQEQIATSVQIHIATEMVVYRTTLTRNVTSNVGGEKARGMTTVVIREAGASIKTSPTTAKDEAVEAETIVTMEAIIITGSSITIKISGRDSRTMAMVAKIISSLTSSEL